MRIKKKCHICGLEKFFKEKPKSKEKGEICISCRNLLSYMKEKRKNPKIREVG